MINIQPVNLGLNLGTAHKVSITVVHTLGDNEAKLVIAYYDSIGSQLNASPVEIIVPAAIFGQWGINLGPMKEWALNEIGATPAQ